MRAQRRGMRLRPSAFLGINKTLDIYARANADTPLEEGHGQGAIELGESSRRCVRAVADGWAFITPFLHSSLSRSKEAKAPTLSLSGEGPGSAKRCSTPWTEALQHWRGQSGSAGGDVGLHLAWPPLSPVVKTSQRRWSPSCKMWNTLYEPPRAARQNPNSKGRSR